MSLSSRSPVTGNPIPDHWIHADNSSGSFRDVHGRVLLLRGVNLASSAKTPTNHPSWKLEGFWESAESGELSWVNRTLDLDDDSADLHLAKLQAWGFTCFRYVFTWESIEHEGPGKYDEKFIAYTVRMLEKIKSYGFRVFMDPHQDLFSRFAGGDGAPYWAVLATGMNPRGFTRTNAAVIHCEWPDPDTPDPHNFPDMIWASNYQRLANLTMNTLFWAGKDFAPKCIIDGKNIQDWLTSHYFNAVRRLGEAIAAHNNGSLLEACVIGWDSLNEPNGGLVGVPDITLHSTAQNVLRIGPTPTAFEAMRAGMGEKIAVDDWEFSATGPRKKGSTIIDPRGSSAWLTADQDSKYAVKYGWKRDPAWTLGTCIWALHGVWDVESRTVLQPGYFNSQPRSTEPVDFGRDYWLHHFKTHARVIRSVHPEAILFAHSPVFEVPPDMTLLDELKGRAAFSTHFYDGVTLVTKHWNWFNYDIIGVLRGKYWFQWQGARVGEAAIRSMLQQQITYLREDGKEAMGNYPAMLSETGQPFDLDDKKSFRTGDYKDQIRALDAIMNACDGKNSMNFTTWCYSASNSHRFGEEWNGEDLSLYCVDDHDGSRQANEIASSDSSVSIAQTKDTGDQKANEGLLRRMKSDLKDMNDGGRGILAFNRPFPTATVGRIKKLHFEIATTLMRLEVVVGHGDVATHNLPTEIYIPPVHYIQDVDSDIETLSLDIRVSGGRCEIKGLKILWYYDQPQEGEPERTYWLELRRAGGALDRAEIAERSSALAVLLRPISTVLEHCTVS